MSWGELDYKWPMCPSQQFLSSFILLAILYRDAGEIPEPRAAQELMVQRGRR